MSATCGFSLVGVVNGDPEVETTKTGMTVCKLLLNCQTQKFAGGGMQIDYSDYEVKAFGKVGERLAQCVNGSTVAISGNLESRSYRTQQGKDGRALEMIARDISILSDAVAGVDADELDTF